MKTKVRTKLIICLSLRLGSYAALSYYLSTGVTLFVEADDHAEVATDVDDVLGETSIDDGADKENAAKMHSVQSCPIWLLAMPTRSMQTIFVACLKLAL